MKLRGEVEIDPTQRDLFASLIEERQRIKRNPSGGQDDAWRSQALKITANSTAYGINTEMLREETPTSRPVDIDVHTAAGSFQTLSSTPELPRHFCFPPIATLITAGARLILAAFETQVRDAGGTIAYMDTDSAAVVSTQAGGTVCCGGSEINALSWSCVDEIAERFASLNPYDPEAAPGSILELESENHPEREDEDEQLHLYVLGSKRYAMYKLAADGTVIVRKFSEHGLGLRLDPTDPAAPVNSNEDNLDSSATDGDRARKWIEQLWTYLIETDALGRSVAEPSWFDRPALYKTTITTPELAERLKLDPFNFILCAQPKPLQAERSELRLIAPFNTDSRSWTRALWTDARTATKHKITTGDIDGTITDRVYVKSYRDITIEFLARPEAKLASCDGQAAGRRHRGLLTRRVITAGETVHIGKEGNHIDEIEVGLLRGDEALNRYTPPSIRAKTFDTNIRPIMRAFTVAEIADKAKIPTRTIERIRAGATPHHSHEKLLIDWAVRAARQALKDAGANIPADRRAILIAWTGLPHAQRAGARHTCEGCGQPLPHGRRRYHSEACRSKARRKGTAADAGSRNATAQPRRRTSVPTTSRAR